MINLIAAANVKANDPFEFKRGASYNVGYKSFHKFPRVKLILASMVTTLLSRKFDCQLEQVMSVLNALFS